MNSHVLIVTVAHFNVYYWTACLSAGCPLCIYCKCFPWYIPVFIHNTYTQYTHIVCIFILNAINRFAALRNSDDWTSVIYLHVFCAAPVACFHTYVDYIIGQEITCSLSWIQISTECWEWVQFICCMNNNHSGLLLVCACINFWCILLFVRAAFSLYVKIQASCGLSGLKFVC